MYIEQFVMAYGVEQDRLRAILPEGFSSLRPVLRINGEIRADGYSYLEVNTAVERADFRGWLNIAFWEDIPFYKEGRTTVFRNDALEIAFTAVGLQGGCPAEKDNGGCWYLQEAPVLKTPEQITVGKEFCDCRFRWRLSPQGAFGESIGKTLPAIPTPVQRVYPRQECTAETAACIPCQQVLGSYMVCFER